MNWQRLLFPAAIIASVGIAQAADEMVTLNFVNADIDTVVKAVGKITRRNFLIDPRVKGTVNIVSGRPISSALTYQVLLAALRLQGFTAVDANGVTIILPEADAKQHGAPVAGVDSKSRGNEMTTEVFTLKYGSAAQLIPVLRPLVAPNNPVTTYPGSNAIIITDYADNLRRIAQVIESIDQPSADEPILVPVLHQSATDLAGIVTRMLSDSPKTDPDQRVTVIPDQRSNSLVIRSQNPARVASVRALIERLDRKGETPGNIHVVYLRNADATKLAQTLRAIVTGESGSISSGAATLVATSGAASGASGSGMATGTEMATGSGFIQADVSSNALIITAPDAVFENLRTVIDKLDVRRAQVHIEALIAEVTSDKLNELGIQWQGINSSGNSAVIAGTNFSSGGNNLLGITSSAVGAATGSGASTGLALPGNGLNLGIVNRITLPGGKQIWNLTALAHALQTDGTTNILSTPNLLTLDNEEASIVVGQNVPFITGQYAQTGSTATATPFQTIERKDVGLTLKVKPQITEGGTVRLRVMQEVSSVFDLNTNGGGVITNKRGLDSTVLLGDGQTIVLGGLIQDSVTDGVEKVPLLGNIPILGALFSYSKKHRTKTNLMVFLRPTIIRDANIPDRLTQDRYNFVIGEQQLHPESAAQLPGFSPAPAQTLSPSTPPAGK